jgi:hypothetical protein
MLKVRIVCGIIFGVNISFLNSWEFLDIYIGDLSPHEWKGVSKSMFGFLIQT